MTYRFRAARTALARDPGHLPIRDRAALRILNRTGAATVAQLTVLVYRNRRLAQARLRRLWEWGYLERTTLPPAGTRGGAPHAYRLTPAAADRLGYTRARMRGPGYLAHTLDGIEAVCSLIASTDPESDPRVLLWLPESIAADVLPGGPLPDAVVVLAADGPAPGSLVLLLEIDESNQHMAPIQAKLAAYRRSLTGRPGWHVLFIVPSAGRAAWLRRLGAHLEVLTPSVWVTTLDELRGHGIETTLVSVERTSTGATKVRLLPAGPPSTTASPVGTVVWLELIGSGGAESFT